MILKENKARIGLKMKKIGVGHFFVNLIFLKGFASVICKKERG